ncbi:MAG: adenylate/guanylate cyclase domain-containing protein [Bacteroidia bacterium]
MLFISSWALGQEESLIDSFQIQLAIHKQNKLKIGKDASPLYDSTEANILFGISKAYFGNDPSKATAYADQLLHLSNIIGYAKGIANANYCLGNIAMDKGDYLVALTNLNLSVKQNQEIANKEGLAACYNSIGIIYWNQGNYTKALESYFSSLKLMEEVGNKFGIAVLYGNIGIINVEQGNVLAAEKNYLSALKTFKEIRSKQGIATSYNNLGNVYADEGKHEKALQYYLDALTLQKEMKNDDGISISYNNIGEIYINLENLDEALKNLFEAVKYQTKIEDKEGMSGTLLNIGTAYFKKKNLIEAEKYLDQSLNLSKEIGSLDNLKFNYEALIKLDSAKGDFKNAFRHYKLYISTRDSLYNEENTRKSVQAQMQYDFDKKESLAKADQDKKDALAKKELQKQKLFRDGSIVVLTVVAFFAIVFFNQRNKIRNGKKRSDDLLLNILPLEVAEELKQKGNAQAKQFESVTVMFTDFKNFTQISERLSPSELVDEIDTCFKAFDEIISRHKIEKIKTMGDSYMCAGGLPISNSTHAVDVVSAGLEIQQYMSAHQQKSEKEGRAPFEIRIGIHTGPVVAGIVGSKKFAYDIWGDAVNIASRMESSGEAGKVNISGSTFALVKDQFQSEYRGKVEAKNKGEIDMYYVYRAL